MYRTYEKPDAEYVITHWDGDCYSYTVCENETEYKEELARIKRIDDEYKEKMENYMKSLND